MERQHRRWSGRAFSLLLACPLAVPAEAQLEADEHTLLLLRFDGEVIGVAGEVPVELAGTSFESGVHGQGLRVDGLDRVIFGAAGELAPASGTVEFWIRPSWNGIDGQTRTFFSLETGGVTELWFEKDGADNLVFIIRFPDSEAFQAHHLGSWNAFEWHHLAATWEIPGAMRVYTDGFERVAHQASAQDLLDPLPALLSIGGKNGAFQAEGVLDELRISDVARSAAEIARSFLDGVGVSSIEVRPLTDGMYPTWRQTPGLSAVTALGDLELPPGTALWSVSDPLVAAVDSSGRVTALAPGSFEVQAEVAGVQDAAAIQVLAPARPPEHETVDEYLATPAAGHLHEIPVLVLRYLPTADGTNLDVSWDPDFFDLNPLTLDALRARIDAFDRRVKFMLEEGSRFRGHARPDAPHSLGYRVIEYLTVYEPTPPGQTLGTPVQGLPIYLPDYEAIFERFGVEELVNERGVREIWFWSGGLTPDFPSYDPVIHTPDRLRGSWESNLSSPVTGDISNSDRDPTDLPVYEHAYVVYGQNFRRSQAEAVHNHGHQLEAMLSHANERQDGNTELFWQRFVGRDADFSWVQGRCGDTHHPPNALADYDYLNPTPVASDILDWLPEGGPTTLVDADTWGDIPYAWPDGPPPVQRVESQWYVLWMQSMPGFENRLPFGSEVLTNWWAFTADWDGSILAGMGLHAPVTPTGAGFVLVADRDIEIDSPVAGAGDLHANGDIRLLKGRKKELACDLFAVNDVRVERGNVLDGSITAGGEVSVERGAEVLGPIAPHASVAELPLPAPSFTAGGPDRTVPEKGALGLDPGSYGRVLVRRGGTLRLRAGSTFFEELVTEQDAVLDCDVSAGSVVLNVVERLVLDSGVELTTGAGEAGSERIELTTLQEEPLTVSQRSLVLGTLVASEASVTLARGSRLIGTLWAAEIEVEPGAGFAPHASGR